MSVFQDALQSQLASVRARRAITQRQALDLLWAYLAYQVHLNTGPQADELIAEDDQFRYIIDDQIVIESPDGMRIPAMLVRPRGRPHVCRRCSSSRSIATPENYAKECAAHGYVGVVAYTRGRLPRARGVLPYEHDGDDARAVIAWIAKQPWSDGRVAMYGSGYSAFTAWAAAKHPPAALKAIATSSAIAPGIDAPMRGERVSELRLSLGARGDRQIRRSIRSTRRTRATGAQLNQNWYRSGRPYDQLDRVDGSPNPLFHRWLSTRATIATGRR